MKIYQVDSFADRAFKGNPAAVCILDEKKSDDWMRDVAAEMNLSETAFLFKLEDGFSLRWFTPEVEVDLCGHATLASAHILWEQGYLKREEEARFHTRSGLLTAKYSDGWIELNFPVEPERSCEMPQGLDKALGVEIKYTGKNRMDYIAEVNSEDEVRNMKPDFNLLKSLGARGVIVTSISNSEGYDFVSRFFCPGIGIDEDPVTGSAHCCLAPYWAEKLNKNEFKAYQASKRGGMLGVTVIGERVVLSGKAVTILKGELSA